MTTHSKLALKRQIVEELEELGLTIVEASVYSASRSTREFAVGIVVGYAAGKAAVFTVNYSQSGERILGVTFRVAGQLTHNGEMKATDPRQDFPDLRRTRPFEGETGIRWHGTFAIGHYQTCRQGSNEQLLASGITLYQAFLASYGNLLRERFDVPFNPGRSFVPLYADAHLPLLRKYGPYSDKQIEPFDRKVMTRFPAGFFVNQWA